MMGYIYDLHDEADRTEFEQMLRDKPDSFMSLDKHLAKGKVYFDGNRVMAAADVIAALYHVQGQEDDNLREPIPTGVTTIIATVNYDDGTRVAVKLTQVNSEVAISLLSMMDEMEVETIPADCTGYHKDGETELFVTISEACRLFPTHAVRWQAFETLYRETLRERAEAN